MVTSWPTRENSYGQEVPYDVKYAKVEWVNFTSGDPTIKLEGDDKEYSLAHLVGMGKVPNPYAKDDDEDGDDVPKEEEGGSQEGDESRTALV